MNPAWRLRFPVPGLFTIQHPVGRDLLAHGLPADAWIEGGLPLQALSMTNQWATGS